MKHFLENYFQKLIGVNSKVLKKVPWWSYKVKKGDNNYNQRSDTVNDFMDFDSDQNF